ncbi:MAG: hypothetical protein ABIN79_15355 [Marmoricola sp.]
MSETPRDQLDEEPQSEGDAASPVESDSEEIEGSRTGGSEDWP